VSVTRSRVLAMAAVVAFFLVGCSSDSETDSASSATDSSASSESTDGSDEASSEEQAFRDCLKENGVELPEEGSSERPDPSSIDQEALQEAMSACSSLAPSDLPSGGAGGGVDQSAIDAFVGCLADRGITVEADLAAIQELDRSKPKVRKAFEKCQGLIAPPQ
jgi:hypothetical protein